MLMFIEVIRLRITDFAKEALAEMGIIFLFCLISGMARTDYYVTGILMIWIFYRWADDYVTEILLYVMLFIMQAELTGIGAIVLILMYNGNLSNRHRSIGEKLIIKYFFYVMYPLHMIILALIFGRIGL